MYYSTKFQKLGYDGWMDAEDQSQWMSNFSDAWEIMLGKNVLRPCAQMVILRANCKMDLKHFGLHHFLSKFSSNIWLYCSNTDQLVRLS